MIVDGSWAALAVAMSLAVGAWALPARGADTGDGAMVSQADKAALPQVVHVAAVSPRVLAVVIQEGQVIRARQAPYVAEAGDELQEVKDRAGFVKEIKLLRKGELVGRVTGQQRDVLTVPDQYVGAPLKVAGLTAADVRITSADDPAYAQAQAPTALHHKAKPNGLARQAWKLINEHTLYLELPTPLVAGKTYRVALGGLNVDRPEISYTHVPTQVRSDAVHVNQVGFGPSDPVKVAFVSTWMGAAGGLTYEQPLRFAVIDEATGEKVFSGEAGAPWPADKMEDMAVAGNTALAPVYRLDFSALNKPGRYRVLVEGVGTSYPFEVRDGVWTDVFRTSVRGLYHQRSGIALEKPYTDFCRPRPHHPEDRPVYQSKATLMDTSMGLNVRGRESFEALVAERTDELVPEAWGGMQDAGDWDRRSQHLEVPRTLFELLEIAPELAKVNTNVPESGNDLPDVADEALWIVDFYKRIQLPNGAVRGGVEAAEHPGPGDTSWTELQPVFVYGPDPWTSFHYAAAAAQAAHYLMPTHPEKARDYQASAEKAMAWAEPAYQEFLADRTIRRRPGQVAEYRALAALELYRLTGEKKWHDVFVQHTVLTDEASGYGKNSARERDSVFLYARLDEKLADATLKARAKAAIIADAEFTLQSVAGNAFGLARRDARQHGNMGFYSSPLAAGTLVRAHALTGDAKYLRAMFVAAQYSLGANPDNYSFTTGLGSKTPQFVLHVDSTLTGQLPPPGITVYGPLDPQDELHSKDRGWFGGPYAYMHVDAAAVPDYWSWPAGESYIDAWNWVSQNEYTPQQTFAPSAYVWGYMAVH